MGTFGGSARGEEYMVYGNLGQLGVKGLVFMVIFLYTFHTKVLISEVLVTMGTFGGRLEVKSIWFTVIWVSSG